MYEDEVFSAICLNLISMVEPYGDEREKALRNR